jgi:dTDP-4-amino-4,6-dideoxygalactose transaminase
MRITEIAKKHGVRVLEDAAQAHGATIGGVQVGNFGDATAFSFYPTKNLGAFGDGGAVVTNNAEVAERLKRLRVYGEKTRYNSVEEGVNSRLDEIQAAILSWGLGHLKQRNERRREIAQEYRAAMKNPAVSLPVQTDGVREGVWHLFVVQVENREHFMEYMKAQGIGTAVHYPTPVYRQGAYAFLGVDPEQYPVTERNVARVVSLPLFPDLMQNEIDEVIAAVNSYKPLQS